MNTVTVLHNQSIEDIAIQATGTVSSVIAICAHNNLSLTQRLKTGLKISIPDTADTQIEIKQYYSNKRIQPASSRTKSIGAYLFERGLFNNGLFE